jgi:hypothetical protein
VTSNDDVRRQQLAENMRFYGDMRFKQLTLLMAWLSLVGGGVAQYGSINLVGETNVRQVLALSAVFFTIVMWVMEVRSTIQWVAHRDAAPELWPRPTNDPFRLVNSTNAVLIFHFGVCSFWLWCAYRWNANCVLATILGLLMLLVSVFSIYHYRHLWAHRERPSSS